MFRVARESKHRSQGALAHDAGLTVTALARIERAQANPAWSTVTHIVGALHMSFGQPAERLERGTK